MQGKSRVMAAVAASALVVALGAGAALMLTRLF